MLQGVENMEAGDEQDEFRYQFRYEENGRIKKLREVNSKV